VLVRGFARSPRDFFLTDPQVGALARLSRAGTRLPVARFGAALTGLAAAPVSGDATAGALRCLPRAELRPLLYPAAPPDRPVGISGQWHGIPGEGQFVTEGFPQAWHPLFQLGEPGTSLGIGSRQTGLLTPATRIGADVDPRRGHAPPAG
jgi:hypothetical protein